MTSFEYRKILAQMTPEQRRALNDGICLGNQPDVDQMVHTFENYHEKVEPIAVRWLNRNLPGSQAKTETQRVDQATLEAGVYARRSYHVSLWAIGIALVSMIIAIFK